MITTLKFHADLVGKLMGCHMPLLPQPMSLHSLDPPDYTIFSYSIMESTAIVNKDQGTTKVGVAQLTCSVIYDEYDWELEHQPTVKDDLILFTPPPLFPGIFGDSAI